MVFLLENLGPLVLCKILYETDCSQLSSQMALKETCVESKGGHVSPLHSAPDSKDANSDGFVSLADSGENQMDGGKYNSKHGVSPSYCDKSVYSSMVCVWIPYLHFV